MSIESVQHRPKKSESETRGGPVRVIEEERELSMNGDGGLKEVILTHWFSHLLTSNLSQRLGRFQGKVEGGNWKGGGRWTLASCGKSRWDANARHGLPDTIMEKSAGAMEQPGEAKSRKLKKMRQDIRRMRASHS